MMDRRKFVRLTGQVGMLASVAGLVSFKNKNLLTAMNPSLIPGGKTIYPISLAQWSLNKAIREYKTLAPLDFAKKARELGFDAIEFVNQLYQIDANQKNTAIPALAKELKKRSLDNGTKNVQMMIDNEGMICASDANARQEAINNHRLWIDASHELGCVSMRLNLFGDTEKDPLQWHQLAVEGLSRLCEYAAPANLNVVVENHGGLSSDAAKLAAVMKEVNKPNCGTLPDFGNFCIRRAGGEQWDAPCVEEYDIYKGTEEMMPYAKGVSAKTFNFKADGNEATIDYQRMAAIIRDAGFEGYLGIEYEGDQLGEEEGILATRKLLERVFHAP